MTSYRAAETRLRSDLAENRTRTVPGKKTWSRLHSYLRWLVSLLNDFLLRARSHTVTLLLSAAAGFAAVLLVPHPFTIETDWLASESERGRPNVRLVV